MNIQQNLYGRLNRSSVLPLVVLIFSVLIFSLGFAPALHAEIYKCVNSQGHASYSAIPCQSEFRTYEETTIIRAENVVADRSTDSPTDGFMESIMTEKEDFNTETILSRSKKSSEAEERQELFAVDGKIRELQKQIDKLQRERAKEIAAADIPEATHSSVYRAQSEIRTRFDTLIASDLDTISQLRKKRQTLIQKVL